jgi:PHP family Zn ribbon phosphoesterase
LNGIFIPAHIDKAVNSIFSQLGFIPPGLNCDGMGITCFTTQNEIKMRFSIPESITLIKNSDAHYPQDIGKGYSWFTIAGFSFDEIKKALLRKDGRLVSIA